MSARTRLWIEWTLSGIAAVLTIVSLICPAWFEMLLDESPDGGDGSAERLLALVWLVAAIVFALLARTNQLKLRRDETAADIP